MDNQEEARETLVSSLTPEMLDAMQKYWPSTTAMVFMDDFEHGQRAGTQKVIQALRELLQEKGTQRTAHAPGGAQSPSLLAQIEEQPYPLPGIDDEYNF